MTARENPALEAMLAEDRDDPNRWQIYADWLLEQGESWGEQIVAAHRGEAPDLGVVARGLVDGLDGSHVSWDHGVIDAIVLRPEQLPETEDAARRYPDTLARILRHPAGRLVRSIDLGLPPLEPGDIDWHFQSLIDVIAAAGPLPLLERLDMVWPADHMDQRSWRRIGDLRALWAAAPRLAHLAMEGSSGTDGGTPIALGATDAPNLRHFEYISSGLDESVLVDLAAATLPALTHLDLYFGSVNYGNTCSLAMLATLLETRGMPKLAYLGLRNSTWEADFVDVIANSSLLRQVKTLDLSLGVFYLDGPRRLVHHADKFRHLAKLDVEQNYIPFQVRAALREALPNLELSSQREDGDRYRYCQVGE